MRPSLSFRPALFTGCLTILAVCLPALAQATTLNVPAQFSTIQAAVNASQNGDTVLIANGTYSVAGDVDVDLGGRNITITSQSGPTSTIINCKGANATNHRGFYLHSGETSASISGLTIENGYESSGNGGGIDSVNAGVTIQNCIFKANTASEGGGVDSYNNAGSSAVEVTGCTFTGNTASFGGGGLNNYSAGTSTITVINCALTGNSAGSGEGGGILNYNTGGGTITIFNCTLMGNTASSGNGGGIYSYNSSSNAITLTNDIVYGDTGGEVVNGASSNSNVPVTYCDVQGGYTGSGNINAAPLFVNAPSDLHLQHASPCLGEGTSSGGTPTATLDGRQRPSPPSIGAFEVDPRVIPTVTLTSSLNPSVSSKSVTITATVAGTGGTPTGTVTFTVDGTAQAPVTLSSGNATYVSSTLSVGQHPIKAAYSGNTTFQGSMSSILTETVYAHISPLYVSPNGNDSNPGTLAAPKLTIQNTINSAFSGDTVTVENGTYTGPGNVDLDFNGKNITIASQYGATGTIIDCQGSSDANHRGFYLHSGETSAVISGLTIENGYETGNGGAIDNENVGVTIQNCTLINNTASYGGGGINNYNEGSRIVAITNCTFIGNMAEFGGGIESANEGSGEIAITNCTLTGNSASVQGGGIDNANYSSGAVTITNNIIYGDIGSEVTNNSGSTSAAVVTYCDIQGGFAGTGNINANPLFVSTTDFHLQPASPCLGAGTETGAPATDKDGVTRPTPPSIGAYELTPMHLLWDNTNGTAVVWSYDTATGTHTQSTYGPYSGWTAVALADGPDGHAHLIWDNTDGRVSVWNLNDPHPDQTCLIYGPYSGWTATGLTVGPDNAVHLLWNNTDGQVSVWNLNDAHPDATCLIYGPYAGWSAASLSVGPNNAVRLLWDNTSGQISIWNLNDAQPDATCLIYGPYTGWTAENISVGPDNAAHLLWDNTDGQVSIWNLNDAQPDQTCLIYGPYAGWHGVNVEVDSSNVPRLLWENTSGQTSGEISLWNLSDPNPSATCLLFGPYAGLTPVGISTAP
ncbi:MAG: Ig-like domain repeat protein [Janthinobacterium lividum]